MADSRPNIVLIILDSLRLDRLGVQGYKPDLTPNLNKMAEEGVLCSQNFSVGCPTQIAMPGLFSSSLPLDFGGYNEGIKHRPASFVESIREEGYQTVGIGTAQWLSGRYGYDRGFSGYLELLDMVGWFQANFVALFNEAMVKWSAGELSNADIVSLLQHVYANVLEEGLNCLDQLDKVSARQLWRSRDEWRERLLADKSLLSQNPQAIFLRMRELGGNDYLGMGHSTASEELLAKIERMNGLDRRFNKYTFLRSRRRYYTATDVRRQLRTVLANRERETKKPLFLMLHLFDLHEAKMLVPSMTLPRAMDLPMDMWKTLKSRKEYHLGGVVHDVGLSHVDREVSRIQSTLAKSLNIDNTVFAITADHGTATQFPNRGLGSDLSRMFYDEYVRVPIILKGPGITPEHNSDLMTHMDLGPTLVDIAGGQTPGSMKGHSILSSARPDQEEILMENTGKGRCDIFGKSKYVSVRNRQLKATFESTDFTACERDVFDLESDPDEFTNLVSTDLHLETREKFRKIADARLRELSAYQQ
jgi:hypothetical protein